MKRAALQNKQRVHQCISASVHQCISGMMANMQTTMSEAKSFRACMMKKLKEKAKPKKCSRELILQKLSGTKLMARPEAEASQLKRSHVRSGSQVKDSAVYLLALKYIDAVR
eukprot:CAMPEP_0113902112 /NCGR_PEP_ID=MMETSP0780_2-20120614/21655_1 /TAXON_ID=652834 /ORGANISM="Palpitomonas bilix" /LENGTH=111 /DNA_ID=CAMNT_0000894853 /DNA_START=662 /DNA_END=995 /DNA_ORIENTATION=- /assembly_acc=CAM_ASM_000599